MKVVKWWIDNPCLQEDKQLRIINKFYWMLLWIRVNVFTIGKEKKELKMNVSLGNLSYRKIKKILK
ncbi:MAG: hypothetical protein ACFFAO_06570 [Candidatus Hermodarchaeota archaeon]